MEDLEIKINYLIIHELIKVSGKKWTDSNISENTLPEDADNTKELIKQLDKSYDSTSISYTDFNREGNKKFREKLDEFLVNDNKEQFMSFTHVTFANLLKRIEKIPFATGGFYVYADYLINGKRYVGVFIIRDSKKGIQLNWESKDKIVDIQAVDYLDINHLAMGCRIEIEKYKAHKLKYLTFTSKKQVDVSEYFKNWVSIREMESSKEYTKTLIDVLEFIPTLPKDEKGKEIHRGELISKACNLIISQPSKIINIENISNILYNDKNIIRRYAEKIDKPLDTEFHYDKHALTIGTKVTIKADDVELKFFKGQTYKVKTPQNNPNIVIIESKEFADSYREKMNK